MSWVRMPWIKSCLCHQEKKKTPSISPPIHLLLKNETPVSHGPTHAFRCKVFKKPRPCHLCHQPILHQGSCCRVCKYVCHSVCESKEAAERFSDTSWQIHRQFRDDRKPVSVETRTQDLRKPAENGHNNNIAIPETKTKEEYENKHVDYAIIEAPAKPIKTHNHDELDRNGSRINKMLAPSSASQVGVCAPLTTQPRAGSRAGRQDTGLDLNYVTERIIALWFPGQTSAASYRQGHRQVAHMLHSKHGNNYMVFNLSESGRSARSEHTHVKEVGWPPCLAPPLERLCSVCKDIDSWLSADKHRIAVLHARGSKDRLGVVVAAYMHYSSICGTADQALDRFSMRRFLDESIGPMEIPSNKRYVDYFSGLLSGNIRINAAPLYLTHVTVLGAPMFENQGGCKAFLKIYEGLTPVYTSGVYNVTNGARQFTVSVSGEHRGGLRLRGDILVKCYHRQPAGRDHVFSCQFHTCAVSDYTLSFTRPELDFACNDPRFPGDGAVELHFSPTPEVRQPTPAPTPAVPMVLAEDPITRYDSYENLHDMDEDSDQEDVNSHTFGPLDGSLYATISKKPELSPGAVSSPLTVSMDSGISSAGHQQNAHTASTGSPPPTAQPSPLSPAEQHRELDELLTDMLLTVENIPDVRTHAQIRDTADTLDSVIRTLDHASLEQQDDIPYHARQDSRPFTYGSVAHNTGKMITGQKGLASPSLVRKASFNKSSGDTLKKVQTGVYSPELIYKDEKHDPIDDIFAVPTIDDGMTYQRQYKEEIFKDEYRRYEPLKRSYTEGTLRRSPDKITYKTSNTVATSPYSDSESLSPPSGYRNSPRSPEFHETYANGNKLTWLQRQQQKLKERRDTQRREERLNHETRLMCELRSVQGRHQRPTASHRPDGYTSDTTAFADDDDDFSVPLHINTTPKTNSSAPGSPVLPNRTSSRKYTTTTSSGYMTTASRQQRGVDHVDSGLLSLAASGDGTPSRKHAAGSTLYREESVSSWRTTSASDADGTPPRSVSPRPQTPAFPVHARTPYGNATPTPHAHFDLPPERLPPKSPTTQRRLSYPATTSSIKNTIRWSNSQDNSKDMHESPLTNGNMTLEYQSSVRQQEVYSQSPKSPGVNGSASPTVYCGTSRRSSVHSNSEPPHEVSPAHVKFVRDTSKFWYKPTISREEAISVLRDEAPGTFVVRDSNSFPGAFGLALKVSTPPANVQQAGNRSGDELVRHFLIEPTSRGVRLKGCANEPVFSSLSALVYQHSMTQMALPCRLVLPEADVKAATTGKQSTTQLLLSQGAACNVLYLFTVEMESLTGPEAVRKAVAQLFRQTPLPEAAVVHFKVSGQGITLTDNKRKLFFRRHYPIATVSHCGLDLDDRRWSLDNQPSGIPSANRVFGFVAKKPTSSTDNQCHVFAELEPDQPATAIVNFVNKIINTSSIQKANIV